MADGSFSTANLAWRKVRGRLPGGAPVSPTCQIPDIRRLCADSGLAPRRGSFVEIGGFDGESFSNTSFLADQGWRGIYVEPVPQFCRQIAARHRLNRVSIIEKAVAATAGKATFHVMGAFSTMSEDTLAAYGTNRTFDRRLAKRREVTVDCIRVRELLDAAKVEPRFDLLVVDIEGMEAEIVGQLAETAYRPRVAIIELVDGKSEWARRLAGIAAHEEVRAMMARMGYREAYRDKINTMFQLH